MENLISVSSINELTWSNRYQWKTFCELCIWNNKATAKSFPRILRRR